MHEPSDHVVCVHALAVDDPTGQHIQRTGVFDNVNFPWASDFPKDMPSPRPRRRDARLRRGCSRHSLYRSQQHPSPISRTSSLAGTREQERPHCLFQLTYGSHPSAAIRNRRSGLGPDAAQNIVDSVNKGQIPGWDITARSLSSSPVSQLADSWRDRQTGVVTGGRRLPRRRRRPRAGREVARLPLWRCVGAEHPRCQRRILVRHVRVLACDRGVGHTVLGSDR